MIPLIIFLELCSIFILSVSRLSTSFACFLINVILKLKSLIFLTSNKLNIRSNLFFRTHYPKRRVNSIYFDNANYSSIRQNLDGISEKKKLELDGTEHKMN